MTAGEWAAGDDWDARLAAAEQAAVEDFDTRARVWLAGPDAEQAALEEADARIDRWVEAVRAGLEAQAEGQPQLRPLEPPEPG